MNDHFRAGFEKEAGLGKAVKGLALGTTMAFSGAAKAMPKVVKNIKPLKTVTRPAPKVQHRLFGTSGPRISAQKAQQWNKRMARPAQKANSDWNALQAGNDAASKALGF